MVSIFGNEISVGEIQLLFALAATGWLATVVLMNSNQNFFEVMDYKWAGMTRCDYKIAGAEVCIAPSLKTLASDSDLLMKSVRTIAAFGNGDLLKVVEGIVSLFTNGIGLLLSIIWYLIVLNVFWFLFFEILFKWYNIWVSPSNASNF